MIYFFNSLKRFLKPFLLSRQTQLVLSLVFPVEVGLLVMALGGLLVMTRPVQQFVSAV